MKVIIDAENLQGTIEKILNENIENCIKECIKDVLNKSYKELFKTSVETTVNNCITAYINDYIKQTKVTVGNSWDGNGVKEYSVEEYMKKKVNELFDSGKLFIETNDGYGGKKTTTVSLEDYVKNSIGVERTIKPYMEKVTRDLKNEVNMKVKSTFDDSLRNALAENVFSIVTAGDTYRNIVNNMKLLGE